MSSLPPTPPFSPGDPVLIPRSTYTWTFGKVVGVLGLVWREEEGPGGTKAVISHHVHLGAIRLVEKGERCQR
jgi:hypothetical protein